MDIFRWKDMDDDTPVPGETHCPNADRWEDFVAGLNSLSRFAAIEANRLRSREYQRVQKQIQRDRKRTNETAPALSREDRLVG